MRSHLDQGGGSTGPNPLTHGNVVVRPSHERKHGNASGTVVSEADIANRRSGGDQGYLQGRTAPGVFGDQVGLPREAQSWAGSGTIYSHQELPDSPIGGGGFAGSMTQIRSSDLDAVDRASGTYQGEPRPAAPPPNPQVRQQQQQNLAPGAYDMGNGMVLVVRRDGQRMQITAGQYQQIIQAAQNQRPLSPAEQALAQIRRG